MLTECSYPYGKEPHIKQTTDNSFSVYLSSPNRNPESDNEGTMIIRFYDKVQEYFDRHNTYILPLKFPISEEEKLRLGSAYNHEANIINLEHLNILRIEIELHKKTRLQPIAKILTGEAQDFLSVRNMLQSLEEGALYQKLDEIFTDILRKFVFPNAQAFIDKEPKKIRKVRELAVKLLSSSPNFYKYKFSAKCRGRSAKDSFNDISKLTRVEKSNSELYQELYNEVFKENKSELLISNMS